MPDFIKIGRDIVVGKGLSAKHWGGPVVVGRDAIYACPDTTRWLLAQGHDSAASVADAALGLVAHVAVSVLQDGARSEDGWKNWIIDSTELAREVVENRYWPLKHINRPVIVLKREYVSKIARKRGKLIVESTGGTFTFALKFFGRSDAVKLVQLLGWELQ